MATTGFWQWSWVVQGSGQVALVLWTTIEDVYLYNKDHPPAGCDFVEIPPGLDRDHVGRFMAYDPETKAFFYAQEKLTEAGLTLAELLAQKPSDVSIVNVWDTWPKIRPTKAT